VGTNPAPSNKEKRRAVSGNTEALALVGHLEIALRRIRSINNESVFPLRNLAWSGSSSVPLATSSKIKEQNTKKRRHKNWPRQGYGLLSCSGKLAR
jgi:hypothetical protein